MTLISFWLAAHAVFVNLSCGARTNHNVRSSRGTDAETHYSARGPSTPEISGNFSFSAVSAGGRISPASSFRALELQMSKSLRAVASPRVVCIDDFRPIARQRLPKAVFDYLDGGAEGRLHSGKTAGFSTTLLFGLGMRSRLRNAVCARRFWASILLCPSCSHLLGIAA